ncbi:MAG: hypothetical protein ABI542_09635 [Gemmatimonadota bacterium]
MEPLRLILLVGALVAAVAIAWLPWRGHLDAVAGRTGFGARLVGILALLALLLDPGIRATLGPSRPLILLDNSVSMHATGMPSDSIYTAAAARGEVISFGEIAPGVPGGDSRLGDALAAAVTAGRSIEVVSDGEVSDALSIPPDLLAQATIQIVPRQAGSDVAITGVDMPLSVAAGDSLSVSIELLVTGEVPSDTLTVELRDGDRVLLSGATTGARSGGRHMVRLSGVLPTDVHGERWMQVVQTSGPDIEPADDMRWRRLRVTTSPGIVILLATPDWDGKFLLSTLESITDVAVRGYVQLRPGAWYRSRGLTAAPVAEVRAAANAAELLAVRGDTAAWRTSGKARLLWPAGQSTGDWYAAPGDLSPISQAFSGVEADSLPALPAADNAGRADWIGLTAQQARRGTPVPIVVGRLDNGRTVVFGAEGLYQWAFRGGEAEQAWRAMVAQTANWLLATPDAGRELAEPLEPVVERGRPVRFHYNGRGAAPPLPVALTQDSVIRTDTLRFDADGIAQLVLPVGRFRYQFGDGTGGEGMVEPWSHELIPTRPALDAGSAAVTPTPVRRSLRDLAALFGLAILGFTTEWILRRRLGLV